MAAKTKRNRAKIKYRNKIILSRNALIFTVIAAAMSYLAYYLRFPNSWTVLLMLVLSLALLKNFSSLRGVNVIIYSIIVTALLLPLNIFVLNVTLAYKIAAFIINLIIIIFVANGLRQMRKWGFYLTIIVFAFSLINIVMPIFSLLSKFDLTLPYSMTLANLIFSAAFSVLSLAYLIKSRKYFR